MADFQTRYSTGFFTPAQRNRFSDAETDHELPLCAELQQHPCSSVPVQWVEPPIEGPIEQQEEPFWSPASRVCPP